MKALILRWLIAATLFWYSGQKLWYALAIKYQPDPKTPVVPEHSILEWWTLNVPNFLPMLMTLELGLGLWLISGKFKKSAVAVAMLLFATFIGMLTYEIVQDDPRPCGCSPEDRLKNAREVKKDLALQIAIDTAVLGAGGWALTLLSRRPRRSHLRGGSASNP